MSLPLLKLSAFPIHYERTLLVFLTILVVIQFFGIDKTNPPVNKAEECAEELEKGLIPLKPYAKMHAEARLSDEQRERLIAWFK